MSFTREFSIGELKLEYEYNKSESNRSDWITIRCIHADRKEQVLFKTICDIVDINAIDFYDKYAEDDGISDDNHEISFCMDEDNFTFEITEENQHWECFNYSEDKLDDFIELFRLKFTENIDFHINEDDLKTRPVLMMKLIRNSHVMIRETTLEEINAIEEEIEEEIANGNFNDSIFYRIVRVNKNEEIPHLEYDILDDYFDEYEEWPYRKSIVDLVVEYCIYDDIDYNQPFKISFYSFLYPEQGESGVIPLVSTLQEITDNKLSIDMVHDIDDEKRLLIKIDRNEFEKIIRSIDYSGIRYHSKHFGIYDGDKAILRERLVDKLIPYKVNEYEVAEYERGKL